MSAHRPEVLSGSASRGPARALAPAVLSGLVLVVSITLLAVGSGWLLRLPFGLALLMAGLAGAAATVLWFQLRLVAPLVAVERASRAMQTGDLGATVPEAGHPVLCRLAEVINSLSADFQEVLLLFAHLLRSARRSIHLLQLHVQGDESTGGDQARAAEIIADIEQMQEMIHDFKYFRVRLEEDKIVDTGVAGHGAQGAAGPDIAPCCTPAPGADAGVQQPCPGGGELP